MRFRALLPALAVCLAAPLLPPTPAAAADAPTVTSLTVVSEAGESIGAGAAHAYTPADSTITVTGGPTALRVYATRPEVFDYWDLNIAPPTGEILSARDYDGAQSSSYREAGRARLSVSGNSRACSVMQGRMRVLDVAFTGDTVDRLHVLFEQQCDNQPRSLFGEIRYRMPVDDAQVMTVPGQVRWPAAYPEAPTRSVPVTLRNTGSAPVTFGAPTLRGDASSFPIRRNGCTAPVAAGGSCVVEVGFAPATARTHTAVLDVPDSTARGVRSVPLSGEGISGHTSWQMRGDAGAVVAGGQTHDWSPRNALFTVSGGAENAFVDADVDGHRHHAQFHPGEGVLEAGRTYTAPGGSAGPGMLVQGDGWCKDPSGTFTVHEIATGGGGLERLSVTFVQHCDGQAASTQGSVAYRAQEPARPVPASPSPPPAPTPTPTPTPTAPAPTTPRFSDLAGDPHEDNVLLIARDGIAGGYADGTFRPGLSVTRGQMATFLVRALELPAAPPAGFTDTAGDPHAAAIDAVADWGIAGGYADGSYRPEATVTRGQMATFLARALDLPFAPSAGFTDTAGDPHERAIDAVADWGITGGYPDGSYRPRNGVTRGQLATFLVRALYE